MRVTLPRLFLLPLLAALHVGAAASCATELGGERAAQLVKQCLTVAPAMRPACNGANSCQRIEQTILAGCSENSRPVPFCPVEAPKGTHEGYLVGGGGIDATGLTIRRDDGRRLQAFCDEPCEGWFENGTMPDMQELKPAYLGKRVSVTVRAERNGERLPGADPGDQLSFVQSIRFLK